MAWSKLSLIPTSALRKRITVDRSCKQHATLRPLCNHKEW